MFSKILTHIYPGTGNGMKRAAKQTSEYGIFT
jgi:hypothetical protein